MCLLLAISSKAQNPAPPVPPTTPPRIDTGAAPADVDESEGRMVHEMAEKANQKRQADLKADTEKLLKLAVQLKADVDKSNADVLSLEVVRKAEEIEKLAHSVKDKMKGPN